MGPRQRDPGLGAPVLEPREEDRHRHEGHVGHDASRRTRRQLGRARFAALYLLAAIGGGLPKTVLVGLPDTALYEARDRCHAAVGCSGLDWPSQLVTINLTPATLPKAGSHYDLAIVAAVLAAAGSVPAETANRVVMMGELGLDGRVRPVRGILPGLLAAQEAGFDVAVVPASRAARGFWPSASSVRP